jgi:hypothetical protein
VRYNKQVQQEETLELTLFETAELRLQQMNVTIRTLVALDKIVRQLDEVDAAKTMLDWQGDPEERAVFLEAIKEKRELNTALSMCADLFQVEFGIEA